MSLFFIGNQNISGKKISLAWLRVMPGLIKLVCGLFFSHQHKATQTQTLPHKSEKISGYIKKVRFERGNHVMVSKVSLPFFLSFSARRVFELGHRDVHKEVSRTFYRVQRHR